MSTSQAGQQATAEQTPLPDLPVRQKSGLVRTASPYQAFVFALSGISVGIMVSWGQFFGTAFYPGANTYLAIAIATVAGLVIYWAYQYWGQVFPRSGGDYLYLSRTFTPALAFGVNFVFLFIILDSPALGMSIMQPLVSSVSASFGLDGLSSWLLTNTGFAVIGTVYLLVSVFVNWLGLKATIRFLGAIWIVGLVGLLILVVALLLSSAGTFRTNLEGMTGLTSAGILSTASQNGYTSGGFDLGQTLKLTVWYTPSLFFAYIVVYIGGEIKNASRTLRLAGMAALTVSGVLAIAWTGALNHAIPAEMQGALAYNAFVAPEATTAGSPYPHELMRVLWGTDGAAVLLTLIGYVTVFAWILIWGPVTTGFVQRGILAWALDGVMPKWVSHVDRRRHAPVGAIAVSFIGAEFLMLLFAFVPSFRTVAFLGVTLALLAMSMLAGVVFPYVRRQLFEQSIIGRNKLLGLPAMSVFCAIGFALMLWQVIFTWRDPVASGTDHSKPLIITFCAIAAGIVYYAARHMYKRRKGEDISQTFKEIPIE